MLAFGARAATAQDPFADDVELFVPGVNGSFGAELLPGIVTGPPRGLGEIQGSLDVLALGIGGSLVLRFDQPVICDGPGPDFTVFENAFHSGSPSGPIFTEFVYVAVSQNGVDFTFFPFDPTTKLGLAGQTPVLSHPDNGISPLDPAVSGGDSFDLADVGLAWAAYVSITDVDGAIADVGDLPQFRVAPNAGADIDAVAAVNACVPSADTPTFTPSPTPSPSMPVVNPTDTPATPTPTMEGPTATATLSPTAATATPTEPAALPGDLDGDGAVTGADATQLIAELYDGDGDTVAAAGSGAVSSGPAADVNGDAHVTAADVAALTGRRTE